MIKSPHYVLWSVFLVMGLIFQAVLSEYTPIWKLNWSFVVWLVLLLRWHSFFLVFSGALLGSMVDVMSHGAIGLYGTSFFVVGILGRISSEVLESRRLSHTLLLVFLLSMVEGSLSLFLLKMAWGEIEITQWFYQKILPVACLHVFITPPLFSTMLWVETHFLSEDSDGEHPLEEL